jgi:hypothetical protein
VLMVKFAALSGKRRTFPRPACVAICLAVDAMKGFAGACACAMALCSTGPTTVGSLGTFSRDVVPALAFEAADGLLFVLGD